MGSFSLENENLMNNFSWFLQGYFSSTVTCGAMGYVEATVTVLLL
jgi:hypothetical protein